MKLVLDGESLSIADLVRAARDPGVAVAAAAEGLARVRRCRDVLDRAIAAYQDAKTPDVRRRYAIYGVTTGFGGFKDVHLSHDSLIELQENILRSHAVGFGVDENPANAANYYPIDIVRAAIILRVNAFLKGHSGVREELVNVLLAMINRGIAPLVPLRGSLGASGDLCPLAHLFVTLLGEGHFVQARTAAEVAGGIAALDVQPARRLNALLGREQPFHLAEKEGLALSNGAVFSAAQLAFAVHDAQMLADTADAAAALSLEAVQGRSRAFEPAVHASRGMAGQQTSAANVLRLVAGSRFVSARPTVQDVYSLRCAPQVHGASRDAIAFCRGVAERELNAATDNPLFFPDVEAADAALGHEPLAFSAGNFHGQPVGLAADVLAIALAELANISERRTQMLLDAHHNQGLPANLTPAGGLHSGLMIAQYTAASLVSENKVLCHPATVDSIPSSANAEDHVAMAATAALKLVQVAANARAVLAVELMAAAQAAEWRSLRQAGQPDEAFAGLFAEPPHAGRESLLGQLGHGTRQVYAAVRERVPALARDTYLEPHFRAAREVVAAGPIAAIVRGLGDGIS